MPEPSTTHKWIVLTTGNWYTEHQCQKCKAIWVEQPEDVTGPPQTGCSGNVKPIDK